MAEKLLIDFEWPVAASYRIEPAPALTPLPDNYVPTLLHDDRPPTPRIVASGPVTMKRPLESGVDLFSFLIGSLDTRAKVLRVTRDHGLLSLESKEGEGEDFRMWEDFIAELRAIATLQISTSKPFTRMMGGLRPRLMGGGHVLWVKPATLRDAVKLQAGQIIAGGGMIKSCITCGEPFVAGGDSGKRLVADYCKDECRHRHNNQKKASAPKPKKKAGKKKPRKS